MSLKHIAFIAAIAMSAPAFAAEKVQCYGLLFDADTNAVLRVSAGNPAVLELAEEGRAYSVAMLPNYLLRVTRFRGSGPEKPQELYVDLMFNPSSGKSFPRKEIVLDGNRVSVGSVNRLGGAAGQFDGTRVALQYESTGVYASFNCARVVPPPPEEPQPAPQPPEETPEGEDGVETDRS